VERLSRQSGLPVKNNRFGKLNTQDLCAIYALLFPSIFDFCAAILTDLGVNMAVRSKKETLRVVMQKSKILGNNSA